MSRVPGKNRSGFVEVESTHPGKRVLGFTDWRGSLSLTLAARSNLVPLTALGYELWRRRALSLLAGRPFPLQEELALMLEAVRPVQDSVFLDLGTATGLYARALLAAGAASVYGLDLSPHMLAEAVRKMPDQAGFIPLLARAEAIPLADESVDGVVVGGSWNEFPDPGPVIAEITRVLGPRGRIWIMFTHLSSSPVQPLLMRAGLRFPTMEGLQERLQSAGFKTSGWREKSVGFVVGTKVLSGE